MVDALSSKEHEINSTRQINETENDFGSAVGNGYADDNGDGDNIPSGCELDDPRSEPEIERAFMESEGKCNSRKGVY